MVKYNGPRSSFGFKNPETADKEKLGGYIRKEGNSLQSSFLYFP